MIRSLTTPGAVRITAKADGLQSAEISLSSAPVEVKNGLSNYTVGQLLAGHGSPYGQAAIGILALGEFGIEHHGPAATRAGCVTLRADVYKRQVAA